MRKAKDLCKELTFTAGILTGENLKHSKLIYNLKSKGLLP